MSYYGLGLNEEYRANLIAQAVHGWRAGHNKRYATVEEYLRDRFPQVEEDAAKRIKRIEQETSK